VCGLFAVIPNGVLNRRQREQLRNLFLWLGASNDDRGGHSWGMWGRDTRSVKGLGYFLNNVRAVNKTLKNWRCESGSWIAGHTRYATHGAKSIANAHPFNYGNLTLAHNGILDVYAPVTGKVPECDSAHLAKYLSEQLFYQPDLAFEDVFKKSIDNVCGSIGLLMSDEAGNLRAYASCQELHVAEGSWGYAISSSKIHLINALDASKLDFTVIYQVPDDHIISPWYAGAEDFFAPSMMYSHAKGSTTMGKTWSDYKDRKKEDTISAFNSFYAGAEGGTSPLGVHDLVADYPTEEGLVVDSDLVPTGSRPGDWEDQIENSPCELCNTRTVGPEPRIWDDPDSGRCYLVCADCASMFPEVGGDEYEPTDMDHIEAMMERDEELAERYCG